MIDDLLNKAFELEIDNQKYDFEFDMKAYGQAETLLNKGIFKIQEELLNNSLKFQECLTILHLGLLKHNNKETVRNLCQKVENSPCVWISNQKTVILAYIKPLLPPEIMSEFEIEIQKHRENSKKKTT